MRRIGIIILAAGASNRLGRPKQLLSFQGHSLILRAARTALASICQPVIVVMGAQAEQIKHEIFHLPVRLAHNPNWALGMGSSIQTGLGAMAEMETEQDVQIDATVLMVTDQPFITPAVLNHLAYSFWVKGGIVASAYNNTLGVPAVFGKEFTTDLLSLPPDEGAKSLFDRYPDRVNTIDFPEGAIDIDTLEDYELLTTHQLHMP